MSLRETAARQGVLPEVMVGVKNSVKPFGTIDTPIPGSVASGSSYMNWGWALTPQPNAIPTNGPTINVYIDGVYNLYWADIAILFPSYNNSNDGCI